MASNDYKFVSHWRVRGTRQEVVDVFSDPRELPRWWRAFVMEVLNVEPGGEGALGERVTLHVKSWLPYQLVWTFKVVEARALDGFAVDVTGDLEGLSKWTFTQDGEYVNIRNDWTVRAHLAIVRYLSWLLKPAFAFNHRWAMKQGEISLQIEMDRRRARTEQERALIPAPPLTTTSSWAPLGLASLGIVLALGSAAYLLTRPHAQS